MKKIALFLAFTIPLFAYSQILHVPDDYPGIQEGIDAASSGDTILVQPGTYLENINFNGKNITVASLMLTTQDTSYISQTIIDGNQSGSVVTFENGESPVALLSGFTITNGDSPSSGGGIACVYFSNPSLKHLIITENSADYNGGGIICGAAASPILKNVLISRNSAGGDGGGIFCYNNCNPYLENVTITGNEAYHGGGICCIESCSPNMNYVELSNNSSYQGGGIFCVMNSNPFMTNVTIDGNSANRGGGVYAENSSISCAESNFIDNEADVHGGAFYYYVDDNETTQYEIDMVNCTFDNNSAVESTGGMLIAASYTNKSILDISILGSFFTNNQANRRTGLFIDGDHITFRVYNTIFSHNEAETYVGAASISSFSQGVFNNCLFYLNEASTEGEDDNSGGASVWSEASVDFINCTFANNTAAYGSALTVGGGGIAKSINCVYWGNSYNQISLDTYINMGGNLSLEYSNVQGGIDSINVSSESTLTWLEGNIDQDPRFVNSGDHDCQINDNSPCIDTGTPNTDTTGLNLPEKDLAGEDRIVNNRVDMGAYEWNPFVGFEELEVQNNKFEVDCYPNPFSILTTIEYTLNLHGTIRITFYNQFGRLVDVVEEKQQKGLNKVVWIPENLADGVYHFRLEAEEQTASGKLMFVK